MSIPSSTRGHEFAACLVTPNSHTKETWIGLMGYRSWLNDFELGRFSLIANRLDRRLLILESPGMSDVGCRGLSPRERWQALHGSYWSVGEGLSSAAHRAMDILDISRADVTGMIAYSMGTSLGVAALKAGILGGKAPTVVLVEPAATMRRSPLQLLAAIKGEDAPTNEYRQDFDAWPEFPPFDKEPPEAHMSLDHMLLGFGLAWGKLAAQAASHPIERLIVIRGTQSKMLSSPGSRLLLADARPAQGLEIVVDGGHGLWHSLPHVSHLLDALKDTLS